MGDPTLGTDRLIPMFQVSVLPMLEVFLNESIGKVADRMATSRQPGFTASRYGLMWLLAPLYA